MFDDPLGARKSAPLLRSTPPSLPLYLVGALLLSGCGTPPPVADDPAWTQVAMSGPTMGTSYHIKVVVPADNSLEAASLQALIDAELVRFSQLLSTYDPDSEISRFNSQRSTEPFPVSPETLEVVKASWNLFEESGGAFDPTVGPLVDLWGFGSKESRLAPPSEDEIAAAKSRVGFDRLIVSEDAIAKKEPTIEIDFSAIAKGYGVDLVAQLLEKEGFADFMVEVGGEVVLRGGNLQRRPWTIGIDSPEQTPGGPRTLVETLALSDCAVATSGDYRNAFEWEGVLYSHLLDPKTGWPIPEEVKSVTVVAPDCMLADGAATAIAAIGAEKGMEWAESREDLEVLIFVRNHEMGFERLQTSGMDRYFQKQPERSPLPSAVGGNE